ncbi:S66 family peptidase [Lentzea chajnantorensis]
MITPPKPVPGDRVAVVSPSAGLPGLFPLPYELGLRRLRELGLEPVEYPATRKMGASPRERAADLHAAFADPDVKAVIASIGGDSQIEVLPHLDVELVTANPKPFVGFSDNTNLLVWLANRGIVGYHGATVMTELGRPGALHPATRDSLHAALFTTGEYALPQSTAYGDVNKPWDDPATFDAEPELRPAAGWQWHHGDRVVEGQAWGGCLEVLSWLLMADREIKPPEHYEGKVLFFETSEEMPPATEVFYVLRAMGERGLLARFAAVLVGRARAWSFTKPGTDRAAYTADQREAVLRAFARYAPGTPIVFDVDLGHTDPQLVVPVGGRVRVDGPNRTITVTY